MDTPFNFPHVRIHKTIGSAFVWSFFQTLFVLYFPENCVRLNIFHNYQCGSNRWMNWKYGVSLEMAPYTYTVCFVYFIYIKIYIICKLLVTLLPFLLSEFYMVEYSLCLWNFMLDFRLNLMATTETELSCAGDKIIVTQFHAIKIVHKIWALKY